MSSLPANEHPKLEINIPLECVPVYMLRCRTGGQTRLHLMGGVFDGDLYVRKRCGHEGVSSARCTTFTLSTVQPRCTMATSAPTITLATSCVPLWTRKRVKSKMNYAHSDHASTEVYDDDLGIYDHSGFSLRLSPALRGTQNTPGKASVDPPASAASPLALASQSTRRVPLPRERGCSWRSASPRSARATAVTAR